MKNKITVEMISVERTLWLKLLSKVKTLEEQHIQRGKYLTRTGEQSRAKYRAMYMEAVMSLENKPQQIIPNININVYPNNEYNNSGNIISRFFASFLPNTDKQKHLEIKSKTAGTEDSVHRLPTGKQGDV